ELLYFRCDMLRMPALLRTAHTGHDAVSTELITPDHDANVRLIRSGPHRWIAKRIVAFEALFDLVSRCFTAREAQRKLRPAGALHLRDQLRQPGELSRAADDIDMGSTPANEFLVLLCHAPQHTQDLARVTLLVGTQCT